MHWVLIWILSVGTGSAYFSDHDQCNAAEAHMRVALMQQDKVVLVYASCETIAEGGMPTRNGRQP